MLTELCEELHNWFEMPCDRHFGRFSISGGNIEPLDFLKEGQYFRIIGSTFNDGVYQYGQTGVAFTDEDFDGAVWAMRVPPAVVELSHKVAEYQQSDAAKPSPYVSETYPNGYSYQKATDGNGGDGSKWQKVFSEELKPWRKL